MDIEKVVITIIDFCVNYSFQVIGAVFVLIIGWMVAGWISSMLLKLFDRKKFDVTLSKFIAKTVKILILSFTFIIALGKFGISIAPLVAAITAMAFGASFAIQGPLSNYGAGLSIIISRPFVVGNTITVKNVSGIVKEVTLAYTMIEDEDGVEINIPNKHIIGEILFNSREVKIAEESIGVSYECAPEEAIAIVEKVLLAIPEVSKETRPQIGIGSFGDSSVNISYRFWVPTNSYYQSLYKVNLAVYSEIKKAGIEIPYPKRDVHILSNSGKDSI